VLLDLGRLFVTSSLEERSDGSSWSPSNFIAMVDVQSEAKTVGLVCDGCIARKLRILNSHDGTAEDLASVCYQFDLEKMDLALLFPRITDWASSGDNWPVLDRRISRTAMKLSLRLQHLPRLPWLQPPTVS
jgi:hypothetical protein